jgi:hypothetical protein
MKATSAKERAIIAKSACTAAVGLQKWDQIAVYSDYLEAWLSLTILLFLAELAP